MSLSRVYVAGSGGMLGSYIRDSFGHNNTFCTDIDVNEDWINYGDVRDYNTIYKQIKDYNPELILNLSALTDLEECEKNYQNCFLTNTVGAINLMEISKLLDVPYVFISTAGVFGGDKEYFTDKDTPNPLSIYAKSKVFAENYILANYEKSWIFRAGWMMGGGRKKDKKFVNKILSQIDNGVNEINVVDDKSGTPTYTLDFAKSMKYLIDNHLPYGLYNMVSKGDATRFDVATHIKEKLNLQIKINKVGSDFFSDEYFAPRPYSEKLINLKLEELGLNRMSYWKDSLDNYLMSLKPHL